jgi:hypothetical protein
VRLQWAESLRTASKEAVLQGNGDAAFQGPHSLLSTDQGIRGFLAATNDIFFVLAEDLKLGAWRSFEGAAATDEEAVSRELASLRKLAFAAVLEEMSHAMAQFDWRTSSAPGLTDSERRRQGVYRGSSGYKELRTDILRHLGSVNGTVGNAATMVTKALGY